MNDVLATYSFLPWLRKGIGAQIEQVDQLGSAAAGTSRPSFQVDVKVRDGDSDIAVVPKRIDLYGPGDVLAIDPRAIVRTEPRQGITNFEPNYLAYLEFYEEDFPWRYSPARAAGDRLRPWLALAVLEESEFERVKLTSERGSISAVKMLAGAEQAPLPPERQAWAWAHVHVNSNVAANGATGLAQARTRLQGLLADDPNQACSRLICPRRLKPNERYHVFLIPAFEQGRLVGLEAPVAEVQGVDSQRYSWGVPHTNLHVGLWPIYYEWSFRTGSRGDFEELVRRITPRRLDQDRVGRRPMDMQRPGSDLLT